MKSMIRNLFSTAMMAALLVGQLPSKASCQMLLSASLSKTCAMTCCKAKLPMPKCPMIKAQAPRDTIAGNTLNVQSLLQPLHHLAVALFQDTDSYQEYIAPLRNTIRKIFTHPAQAVRAPPAFIHLLNA